MNHLVLSITKIGDLLLHQSITNGEEPIKDISLNIPIYQRPYKWTARNAIQLLDDIIDAKNSNKESYRVGTLILHKAKDKNQYDIVDGQQRTITFSLLLHALYELEEPSDRLEIKFLKQQVFDNPYSRHNIPNNLNAFKRRTYKDPKKVKCGFHQRDERFA